VHHADCCRLLKIEKQNEEEERKSEKEGGRERERERERKSSKDPRIYRRTTTVWEFRFIELA